MTLGRRMKFYNEVDKKGFWEEINHKAQFDKRFEKYLNRNWLFVQAASKEEFVEFVKENSPVFIKGCRDGWGNGIRKIKAEDVDLEKLYDELIDDGGVRDGGYVAESAIIQCREMSAVHPQSVNTVRVVSFYTGKRVEIIGAILRCGVGDAFVDNHSAGGVAAIIDVQTGTIVSDACGMGLLGIKAHPDTGVVFKGLRIPHWELVLKTINELAVSIPGVNYIGWDIAITEDAIALVEGNPHGEMTTIQEIPQKGIAPKIHSLLEEYRENYKNS